MLSVDGRAFDRFWRLDQAGLDEALSATPTSRFRVADAPDGDVAGAISVAWPDSGSDILFGVGGTPEGVIAACALKCLGGAIFGRLWPRNDDERTAALEYDAQRRAHLRVLQAFIDEGIVESDFAGSTGYGYDDAGRARYESLLARVLGAERALARLSIVSENSMLVHPLLEYFLCRTTVTIVRVSRTSIPLHSRLDRVMRDNFCGNYFREPRTNALCESLTITDGITLFDEFEERPKFLLR